MANSQEAKRIAVEAEHLRPDKVSVIYQGVDMSVYNKDNGDPGGCDYLGIPADYRVVGMVANLRPVKDIPLFLRAASLVARECEDVVFLMAGRGEQLEELRHLAAELGLTGRIYFTEGRGQIVDYLGRMCLGCLTSQSEGFSNAILEYMAAGLPVVATDVGGNREAVIDGETGYLIRERTPEALAQPILQLLRDESLRATMGHAGYERCKQHFEIGKTIGALEAFYQSLVA
jgi:glycosyltransferase involved in cell wall biosynthesis